MVNHIVCWSYNHIKGNTFFFFFPKRGFARCARQKQAERLRLRSAAAAVGLSTLENSPSVRIERRKKHQESRPLRHI